MKPPAPPRIKDVAKFSSYEPPERSARCDWWVRRFQDGWRPNRRVESLGYYESSAYYGVYVWEYINVLSPLKEKLQAEDQKECA